MEHREVITFDQVPPDGLELSIKYLRVIFMLHVVRFPEVAFIQFFSQLNLCFCFYRVPDPEDKLPAESYDASTLKQCFQKKGFL